MKKSLLCLLFINLFSKHLVVVIPSYNNVRWCEKNLSSVLKQNYKDYHIIYIDDCSKDGTQKKVSNFLQKNFEKDKYTLICNKNRQGAMANWYNAITQLDDKKVVVNLDGDDWLYDENVLQKINDIYENKDIWITFGNFVTNTGVKNIPRIPDKVFKERTYRSYRWAFSHLRTFYAGLFKKVKKEDFMFKNKFLHVTCDQAMILPMLEMAGNRVYQFTDILYVYNIRNPIGDFKKYGRGTSDMAKYIRSKSKYPVLDKLW